MNAIGKCEKAKSTQTDEGQRRTILRLLKQEYVKLRERPATSASKFER
jgi:hypothetical protein